MKPSLADKWLHSVIIVHYRNRLIISRSPHFETIRLNLPAESGSEE